MNTPHKVVSLRVAATDEKRRHSPLAGYVNPLSLNYFYDTAIDELKKVASRASASK